MNWNQNGNKNNDSPPDLDELISKFFKKKDKKNINVETPHYGQYGLIFLIILSVLYFLSGFYIVSEPENAVITRFGKFSEVKYSGLNWNPRFIDRIYIIDVHAIDSFKKEHMMLTEDENIIYAGFEIQYRKNNPISFLFNDENPILTLNQLSESAIREVIGHSKLDEILTTGKQQIIIDIKKLIEQSLLSYEIGIELQDVNLSFALPPTAVQQSFNDVTKAREDEQAYQNEADRYRESKVPVALGLAQRIKFEADAYAQEKILKAQAETAAFDFLFEQYKVAPDLMRNRLYLDMMEKVLSSTSKIIIDKKTDNNIIYLNLSPNDLKSNESNLIAGQKELIDSGLKSERIPKIAPPMSVRKGDH